MRWILVLDSEYTLLKYGELLVYFSSKSPIYI